MNEKGVENVIILDTNDGFESMKLLLSQKKSEILSVNEEQ